MHPLLKYVARITSVLLGLCAVGALQAQPLDRVLAVVGSSVILQSDVDNQYRYLIQNGEKDDGTLRCQVFENFLTQKLLLEKALLDSLEVTDDQVESELNRRLQRIIGGAGSQEEVEKLYGKPILQIKNDLRPDIRNQLLVNEQQRAIFQDIKATPREVRQFFARIPKDSIPFLPAEVEVSQIVIVPKASDSAKTATRQKLAEIRDQIATGEMRFAEMARFYSQDRGSAQRDGDLGEFGRGVMAAEFEEAVYTLSEGEISPVFESPFGYHVAQLRRRLGDRVQAAHILLTPPVNSADEARAKQRLLELKQLVLTDSLTFGEVATKFSEDEYTRFNQGNLTTDAGERSIPLDQLDSETYFAIDNMKEGDISEPLEYITPDRGAKAYRILFLQRRTPPHLANLESDYQKFYNATIQSKRSTELDRWFAKARQQVYVEIKENDCSQALQNWQ